VFSGAVTAVSVASIGLAFPDHVRPRAFAAVSSVWGVMGVAGPAVAALMISTTGWRGIFLVNVPVTLLAAAIGWNRVPDRRPDAARQPVDRVGLALITVLTTAALFLAAGHAVVIAVAAAVATTATVSYVAWARRAPHPVVRIRHLTDPRYRSVHLTAMGVIGAGVGANSLLPLYLRTVRGQSAGVAAFSVLFLTFGWTASAIVSSRLQDRHPGEKVCLLGVAMALPAVMGATAAVGLDAALALVYLAFVGIGAGVGMVTATGAVVLQARSPMEEMGRLTGAHQFLRTLAITFGIAAVGAIVLAVVASRTGDVELVRSALAGDDGADELTDRSVLDALRDGYTWAIAAMTVGIGAALVSAIGLARSTAPELASAP
jgi:DHA2 family methylenomycin A resistance protein-like MFS transporter